MMPEARWKTVVALFEDLSQARLAAEDLAEGGLSRDSISLIPHASVQEYGSYFNARGRYLDRRGEPTNREAVSIPSRAATGGSIGTLSGALAGLLLGLAWICVAGVTPLAAGVPLQATLAGALLGCLLGAAVGAWLRPSADQASFYAEGARSGGSLITVKTDEDAAGRVREILDRHGPVHLEERVSFWRQGAWAGYDAEPFSEQRGWQVVGYPPPVRPNLSPGRVWRERRRRSG